MPLSLSGPYSPFIHSEVVRHFVPNGLFDESLQVLRAARQAFVRALETP